MNDKLKCLLCGKLYDHLGSHIWHGHHITAREYKEEFELPYNMSLISHSVYLKKSEAFEKHREKYVKNLLKNGKKYQFKKGCSGVRRISQHERNTILERIEKVNKSKRKLILCPVCRMKFYHLESHLFNKHKMLSVKNYKL
ncbi:MAG TPA: hypothetical protein ENI63_00780 [Candidatus Kaiserbacteria bacterium]|nr:hypothetical protein [Candidatus Kaiserbacteria bacterium]